MWKLCFTFLVCNIASPVQSSGNEPSFNYFLNNRVDTSDAETAAVLNRWLDYLASKPDSNFDNPHWNRDEKRLADTMDFDLSATLLYQFPSTGLLAYYTPTILSVERRAAAYEIRTLFYAEGLEDKYRGSNPWAIVRVYAIREDNEWKLKNALPFITRNWNDRSIGDIRFVYPPEHTFNEMLARKTVRFCDSVCSVLNLPSWEPFTFYICAHGDEVGRLLGFDYFFAGYTTGVARNSLRMMISGLGSEWYPHECVHMVVGGGRLRHRMLDEGLATWLGGARQNTRFQDNLADLRAALRDKPQVRFSDILQNRWGWQVGAYYTSGAVLCKLVYDHKGADGLWELLTTPQDDTQLKANVSRLLDIEESSLDRVWRAALEDGQ